MSFYSQLSISPLENQLHYSQSIVTLGSCFSDQIGRLLAENRFDVSVNPLGILFNPQTIAQHLATAITSKTPRKEGFLMRDEICYHHDFHSSMRALDHDALESMIVQAYQALSEDLQRAKQLIITLGTAVAYRKNQDSRIVGNCHKVPQNKFSQILISEREISTRLSTVFCALKEYNPSIQIILTVSPVRYLKFGAVTNNRSKSQLLSAAMRLEQRHNFVTYWPAYEIFIDELRDYRWVEADLVHPNQQAIEQIWSRFITSSLSDESKLILKEIKSINKQLNHKPFNPQSNQHLEAQSNLRKRISKLKQSHPYLKLSEQEVTV